MSASQPQSSESKPEPKDTVGSAAGEPGGAQVSYPSRRARREAEAAAAEAQVQNAAAAKASVKGQAGSKRVGNRRAPSGAPVPVPTNERPSVALPAAALWGKDIPTSPDTTTSTSLAGSNTEPTATLPFPDTHVPVPAETPQLTDESAPVLVSPDVPVPVAALDAPNVKVTPGAALKLRAGRDLPAAVGVGLGLLALVLFGLLLLPLAFLAIVVGFGVVGVWEVNRALELRGIAVPVIPVFIGAVAIPVSAYFSGSEGLLFAFAASAATVLIYRTLDPAEGSARSVFAGVFVLAWIPFMISFALVVLHGSLGTGDAPLAVGLAPGRGSLLVAVMLLLVVANDTFGYLVGAFLGKHPMAPKISPKKSWEGFAGSIGGAIIVAVLCAIFLLHLPWWIGLILAVGMVAAATAGDLAESMVKRELGIKDMGNILPGHGGVMDRLDSILFGSPMAFLLFAVMGLLPG